MSIIQSVPNICFSNGSGDGDGDKLWCFVLLNEDVLLGGQTIAVPGRQNSDALAEERDFVIASQPKKTGSLHTRHCKLHCTTIGTFGLGRSVDWGFHQQC